MQSDRAYYVVLLVGLIALVVFSYDLVTPAPLPATPKPLVITELGIYSHNINLIQPTELTQRNPKTAPCSDYFAVNQPAVAIQKELPAQLALQPGVVLKTELLVEDNPDTALVLRVAEAFSDGALVDDQIQALEPSNYLIDFMLQNPHAVAGFSYQYQQFPIWIEGIVFDENIYENIQFQVQHHNSFLAEFGTQTSEPETGRFLNDQCFAYYVIFHRRFAYWLIGPRSYDRHFMEDYSAFVNDLLLQSGDNLE